jgi:DNA polymerase-3 subunit epsilon
MGICKGACVGKEPALKYMIRFLTAFAGLKVKPWPFKGPIAIEEENILSKQQEYFLVDKWCYIGSIKIDEYGTSNEIIQETTFDVDTYNILRRFLNKVENIKHIKLLSQLPVTNFSSRFAV